MEGLRRQEAERESLTAAQRLDGHGTTPSGRKLRPRLVPQAERPTPRSRRPRSPSSFVEKYQVFEEDEARVQSMAKRLKQLPEYGPQHTEDAATYPRSLEEHLHRIRAFQNQTCHA